MNKDLAEKDAAPDVSVETKVTPEEVIVTGSVDIDNDGKPDLKIQAVVDLKNRKVQITIVGVIALVSFVAYYLIG